MMNWLRVTAGVAIGGCIGWAIREAIWHETRSRRQARRWLKENKK